MSALDRFAAAAKDQPGVWLPVPSCGDEKRQTLGLIQRTGRRVRSTSPGANGRKVDEWIGCTS